MRLGFGAWALAAALAALAALASPVAFVADIRGNATIEGEGKRVTFLTELTAGTRLVIGSHAGATVTYATTGAEFTMSGPGLFLVGPQEVTAERGPAPRRRNVSALTDPGVVTRAAQAATASLRMRGLATSAPAALLEYPVATRVATLQPRLRWKGVDGESYTVAVQDAAGRDLWKGKGSAQGTAPAVQLAPASRYSWTISGSRGSAGEAHFETLPAEAIRRAEASRAAARSFPEKVVHALLLQELGAEQEARATWGALARERSDLAELTALAR